MENRSNSGLYTLLILGLTLNSLLALWLFAEKREKNSLTKELSALRAQLEDWRSESIETIRLEYSHIGRTIDTSGLKKVYLPEDSETNNSRLLILLSDISCDVCQDTISSKANGLASQLTPNRVLCVVQAEKIKYAEIFARMNQVTFPVYYSPENMFTQLNKIGCVPTVFLIDKNNKVLAAHCPSITSPKGTDSFFEAALRVLGQ